MPNKDRKLLFFDIDGTLITDDGKRVMPESTKQAIELARKNGHLTFINSGRVLCNIEDFIKSPGFDGYVCGCGTYISLNDEVLLHNKLTHEHCNRVAKMCRKTNMRAVFEYTDFTSYDNKVPVDEHKELLQYFMAMRRKMVDDIDSEEFIYDKFTAWYSEADSDIAIFKQEIAVDYQCIDRESNFFEIVPKGFSKATGIKYLMDYLGVPLQNIFVFGDSNNDIEMLKYVPNSIAMGKCTDEVKATASYMTDTVENDGIYKAMRHFGII